MSTRESFPAEQFIDELQNFQELVQFVNASPGELPRVTGIDIHGLSLPLRHVIGGDHILYVDFQKRYELEGRIAAAEREGRLEVAERLQELRQRAGILVADVSGHRMTDALIAAMLHQAFLLGVYYELDLHGEVTTKVFEHINARFHQTNSIHKFLTMIYGEIWDDGRFRFISAGHPPPAVFSREFARFVPIGVDRLVSFPPVGMLPSEPFAAGAKESSEAPLGLPFKKLYEVNEIHLLSPGDVLLLCTDGLIEHAGGKYFPVQVEQLLQRSRDMTAEQICELLREDLRRVAEPQDDISFVVVRKAPR
jgi:serine phosphatase RsbU (regulator of sigma subunit)